MHVGAWSYFSPVSKTSCDRSFGFAVGCRENYWGFMSATVTISIMPVRHHTVHTHVHPGTLPGNVNTNWISKFSISFRQFHNAYNSSSIPCSTCIFDSLNYYFSCINLWPSSKLKNSLADCSSVPIDRPYLLYKYNVNQCVCSCRRKGRICVLLERGEKSEYGLFIIHLVKYCLIRNFWIIYRGLI